MKANKKVKHFDTMKTFREIKENISKEIQGTSFAELKEYLVAKRLSANS